MIGGMSIWHWAIVAIVALLLFGGRGKLSGLMGDAAKGIKAFKDGLKDEDAKKDETKPETAKTVTDKDAA